LCVRLWDTFYSLTPKSKPYITPSSDPFVKWRRWGLLAAFELCKFLYGRLKTWKSSPTLD